MTKKANKGTNIGWVIVIGFVIWWLTRSKQAQAAGLLPGETYPYESEYEKLHRVVPITEYVEKELPVFTEPISISGEAPVLLPGYITSQGS